MPCTADLERRDYLDFLTKRPQGTTKILGTPAFAGTKTPAVLKFSSKGATTDCVETPVNCPHCGQKRPGRTSVPTPAVYPAFFFVLEKAAKSAGNAVIPTFPVHCPHGLQHLRHKRPTFAFTSESGYTLGFRRRIAHSGSQGETRGDSDGGAIITLGAFRTFTNIPGPGIRTANFAAFGSWLGVLSKNAESLRNSDALTRVAVPRRRGPAGLRDLFSFLSKLRFSHPALKAFCVCEGGGITTLGVLLKRRTAACQNDLFAVFLRPLFTFAKDPAG